MLTYIRLAVVLGSLILGLALGCSEQKNRGPIRHYNQAHAASRRLFDVTADQVRPIARRAFQQHFRINPDNSTELRFVSRPQDLATVGDPERISDVLGSSRRRERVIAELVIIPNTNGADVRCVVERQRLETADRAAFAPMRGDDRPDSTAIDRYGTVAVQRREEWVPSGRMRQIENLILAQIVNTLAATRPAENTASTRPQ